MGGRIHWTWLMALALLAGCGEDQRDARAAGEEGGVAVYFSPRTDCRKLVIEQIRMAQQQIHVQAYSFDSDKIAKALVDAHRRGVRVVVILDAEKADKKSEMGFLTKRGIDTYIDASHEKAHSKIILIDGKTVLTGSFNLSDAEEEGTADNLVLITNKPQLLAAYEQNFEEHFSHAKKYEDKKASSQE